MNTSIADDLAYLRDIAESGEQAPSLGGRFLVWWGALMSATMLAHWAVISGHVTVDSPFALLWLWLGASVIGFVGNFILVGTLKSRPGSAAAHNRITRVIWPVAGSGIFLYFAAIIGAVLLRGAPSILFDTILPLAFFGHAVAFAGQAAFSGSPVKWGQVIGSVAISAAGAFLVGLPEIYLVTAVGILGLAVLPGIQQMRAEPKTIV